MDTSWLSTALRALARYARAYPLQQIALAAALFPLLAILIRIPLAETSSEQLIIDTVGGWGINLMAGGLSYLIATAWHTSRNSRAAKVRRSKKAEARNEVMRRQEKQREQWRHVIRGLCEADKILLREFIDHRRRQFEGRELGDRDSEDLQRLHSLGIFEMWWPYSTLSVDVFDLLLAEPNLIGSSAQPTARIKPLR